jgi:hypothetical protein
MERGSNTRMAREGRSGGGGRKAEPPRRERPTVAAALLAAVLDAPTRRQGFADHRLLTDWATIVGPEVARDTVPMKLDRRSRVLMLRVRPPAALAVQHDEPRLLERINAFFGTTVAHKLRLVQGPVPLPVPKAPTPPLDDAERAAIDAAVEAIEPGALRDALAGLGRAVRRRRKRDLASTSGGGGS